MNEGFKNQTPSKTDTLRMLRGVKSSLEENIKQIKEQNPEALKLNIPIYGLKELETSLAEISGRINLIEKELGN